MFLQAQGHSTSPTKRSDYEYLDFNIPLSVCISNIFEFNDKNNSLLINVLSILKIILFIGNHNN